MSKQTDKKQTATHVRYYEWCKNHEIKASIVAIAIAVLIILILLIFIEINALKNYSEIFRNFLLGFAALAAFPFIVWRSVIADKSEKTARKEEEIKRASHEENVFAMAVGQLGSEKESIRLGAVLSFKNIITSTDNEDLIKKIAQMLYCFMEEHIRIGKNFIFTAEEIKEQYHPNYQAEPMSELVSKTQEKTVIYQSQFYEIIMLLKDHKNHLSHYDISYLPLIEAQWQHKDLKGADLTGATLMRATLKRADLRGTDLTGADLTEAKLEGVKLERATYCDKGWTATVFPEGFSIPSSMIDVSDKANKEWHGT